VLFSTPLPSQPSLLILLFLFEKDMIDGMVLIRIMERRVKGEPTNPGSHGKMAFKPARLCVRYPWEWWWITQRWSRYRTGKCEHHITVTWAGNMLRNSSSWNPESWTAIAAVRMTACREWWPAFISIINHVSTLPSAFTGFWSYQHKL